MYMIVDEMNDSAHGQLYEAITDDSYQMIKFTIWFHLETK